METQINHRQNRKSVRSNLKKWLKTSTFNQFIDGVNIIPFKCPLQPSYKNSLNNTELFSFKDVFDFSITCNKPITDVIDLTDTQKYYDPKKGNFFPKSVSHHKYFISGNKPPSKGMVEEILDNMDDLTKKGRVIGVHCKHGVNRTGIIICAFLVLKLGWKQEDAIAAFEKARGEAFKDNEYLSIIIDNKIIVKPVDIPKEDVQEIVDSNEIPEKNPVESEII